MRPALLSALALSGLISAGAARADAIDGTWCTEDGLRMTIQGPNLLSPGGVRMAGDYSRHGFGYAAPAGEPGGGGRVELVLQGENRMRAQAAQGSIEPVWRRCGPPVS